jgi:hypothetical protein
LAKHTAAQPDKCFAKRGFTLAEKLDFGFAFGWRSAFSAAFTPPPPPTALAAGVAMRRAAEFLSNLFSAAQTAHRSQKI